MLARRPQPNHHPATKSKRAPSTARRKSRASSQLALLPVTVDDMVERIWASAVPVHGTQTAQYLIGLGLETEVSEGSDTSRWNGVIRHHNWLHHSKDRRLPGMLVRFEDTENGRPCLLRTYFEGAGKVSHRLIGPAFRAIAKLDSDEDLVDGLHIAVGSIELAISAWAAGYRPLWLAATPEALTNLAPISIQAVTFIGGSNSERAVGLASARWAGAGCEVTVINETAPPRADGAVS